MPDFLLISRHVKVGHAAFGVKNGLNIWLLIRTALVRVQVREPEFTGHIVYVALFLLRASMQKKHPYLLLGLFECVPRQSLSRPSHRANGAGACPSFK